MPSCGSINPNRSQHAVKDGAVGLRARVPDINRSSEYFRGVLGFHVSWQDATDWRLVERDGVRIMLGQCPTDIHPSALGSHNWFGYLDVDDVEGLYAEFTARGAICSAPKDTHYGNA